MTKTLLFCCILVVGCITSMVCTFALGTTFHPTANWMFCWPNCYIYVCTCADQYIHVCILQNVHGDSPIAADCPSSSNQDGLPVPSSNQNGSHVHFSSLKADEDESETSDEIVPVVVRPGHIRFEPAGNNSTHKESLNSDSTGICQLLGLHHYLYSFFMLIELTFPSLFLC